MKYLDLKSFLSRLPVKEAALAEARREMNLMIGLANDRVRGVADDAEAATIRDFILTELSVKLPLPVLVRLLIDDKVAADQGIKLG